MVTVYDEGMITVTISNLEIHTMSEGRVCLLKCDEDSDDERT